jgi:hypothetical protein
MVEKQAGKQARKKEIPKTASYMKEKKEKKIVCSFGL